MNNTRSSEARFTTSPPNKANVKAQRTACAIALLLVFQASGHTAPVPLQQATATFSQTEFSVWSAADGAIDNQTGWAIYPEITNQTAVFQTSTNVGFANGTILEFTIYQIHWNVNHTLGHFRLSVTTDDRATFADGLASGGNVTATWSILYPYSSRSANGTTLTHLPDGSILASGKSPAVDIYTIRATTSLTNITGIRLEALQDPSLPFNGPGRRPDNGNFVVSELQLDADILPVTASIRVSEVEICWLSLSDKTYEVEYRSSLTTNTWTPLFTNIAGNGATICVDDKIVAGQPQRLYRVVALP